MQEAKALKDTAKKMGKKRKVRRQADTAGGRIQEHVTLQRRTSRVMTTTFTDIPLFIDGPAKSATEYANVDIGACLA